MVKATCRYMHGYTGKNSSVVVKKQGISAGNLEPFSEGSFSGDGDSQSLLLFKCYKQLKWPTFPLAFSEGLTIWTLCFATTQE